MDSITPTMNVEEALAMLEGTLAELRDTQAQLATCQAQLDEMNMLVFEQSATDPLTGLKNRAAFERIMNQQSARTGRTRSPLSLLMVDVDDLKKYNEDFGRIGGDDVLQQVAQVLKNHARAYDYVVRYQSDEFAVVLPETTLTSAIVVAERVRNAINGIAWRHQGASVSVGVAEATMTKEGQTVVQGACDALQRAKSMGGNQVVQV